jgi:transposase
MMPTRLGTQWPKLIAGCDGTVRSEIKTFGTMTEDLLALGDWLKGWQITHAAMESTGSYWKPVYNVLEVQFEELQVVNEQHIKAVPGRKTDVKDAEWIADLLRHGLLRGSFIPAKPQRELRELVRHRSNLVGRRAQSINELQRTLESTNIKLASVVSDITGVSATEMLEAMLAGETDAAVLVEMARGKPKQKKGELEKALAGKVEEHHRLILSQLLVDIASYEEQVQEVGALVAVARSILQSCYHMIKRGSRYQDLGADYYDRRDPEGLAKHLAKRIEKLGFTVTVQPLPLAA